MVRGWSRTACFGFFAMPPIIITVIVNEARSRSPAETWIRCHRLRMTRRARLHHPGPALLAGRLRPCWLGPFLAPLNRQRIYYPAGSRCHLCISRRRNGVRALHASPIVRSALAKIGCRRKVERERPNLPNKWACSDPKSAGLPRCASPIYCNRLQRPAGSRGRLRDATVLPLLRDGGCGLISTSSQEYRSRADDCERLAANATNSEVRRTLLYLAKRWRDFAAEADSGQRRSSDGSFPQHPSK
jgi:hypothetical protein